MGNKLVGIDQCVCECVCKRERIVIFMIKVKKKNGENGYWGVIGHLNKVSKTPVNERRMLGYLF